MNPADADVPARRRGERRWSESCAGEELGEHAYHYVVPRQEVRCFQYPQRLLIVP
jgi:hypothetical protein